LAELKKQNIKEKEKRELLQNFEGEDAKPNPEKLKEKKRCDARGKGIREKKLTKGSCGKCEGKD